MWGAALGAVSLWCYFLARPAILDRDAMTTPQLVWFLARSASLWVMPWIGAALVCHLIAGVDAVSHGSARRGQIRPSERVVDGGIDDHATHIHFVSPRAVSQHSMRERVE